MASQIFRGTVFTILSAVLYGAGAVLTKFASSMGLSVPVILIGRGIIGALLALAICGVRKQGVRISEGKMGSVLLLGLLGMCGTIFFLNNAYLRIPVGIATTVHYIYPALVCIASALLFRERISLATWFTVVACTVGTTVLSGDLSGGSVKGVLFAALSAVAWAFYMVGMERTRVAEEDGASVSFVMSLELAAFGVLYGLVTKALCFNDFLKALPVLIAIGLLINILANIFVQKGIESIGAGLSSILSVFEPIAGIVLGALFMKERPCLRQLLGCFIILAAVIFLLVHNWRKEEKA